MAWNKLLLGNYHHSFVRVTFIHEKKQKQTKQQPSKDYHVFLRWHSVLSIRLDVSLSGHSVRSIRLDASFSRYSVLSVRLDVSLSWHSSLTIGLDVLLSGHSAINTTWCLVFKVFRAINTTWYLFVCEDNVLLLYENARQYTSISIKETIASFEGTT